MRELTYYVATSLDGQIAARDGDFSAFPVTGDHMEMILRDWRDALPAPALEALGLEPDGVRFDTVVMGWNTYAVGLPHGVTNPYPHLEQVVFSRSHRRDEVPDEVRVVADDPVVEVQRLKKQDGVGIWLCGGGRLAGILAAEIDRLVLKVNPVVIGDGIPLFAGGLAAEGARQFALVRSTPFRSGVVVNEYERQIS